MNHVIHAEAVEPPYASLYKLGGAAALTAAVLTLSEVILFIFFPQPDTVENWFLLFRDSPVLGLLEFWGLELPLYIVFALVFLAFFYALRKDHEGVLAVAVMFAMLGTGIFLAANNPFSMLSLSNQYAASTTDIQRSVLLGAGEALLAHTGQRAVGGFNTGLFLVSLAGLIISKVMLKSSPFSRSTGYIGIAAHTLSLVDYLRQALTASPFLALLVILPNALLLIAWYVLAGRRLYKLGILERTYA
jgi:hypothetical protein